MTILEIQTRVTRARKRKLKDPRTFTRAGIYKHIKALKLKPFGKSRPAIYPDNSASLILNRLGYRHANGGAK